MWYSMLCGIVYYKNVANATFLNNIGSNNLFAGEDCLVFLYCTVFFILYNILYCIICYIVKYVI